MTHTEITLTGYLVGDIWMPSVKCAMPIRASITDTRERFSDPSGATLRDCLMSIQMNQGGDFQSCDFSCDTEIVATTRTFSEGRSVTRTRSWPITSFPSVADLVDAETFGADFMGGEDY